MSLLRFDIKLWTDKKLKNSIWRRQVLNFEVFLLTSFAVLSRNCLFDRINSLQCWVDQEVTLRLYIINV